MLALKSSYLLLFKTLWSWAKWLQNECVFVFFVCVFLNKKSIVDSMPKEKINIVFYLCLFLFAQGSPACVQSLTWFSDNPATQWTETEQRVCTIRIMAWFSVVNFCKMITSCFISAVFFNMYNECHFQDICRFPNRNCL